LSGEQYALNEAVERLRRVRRDANVATSVTISAADPLHLPLLAGTAKRAPAVGGQYLTYRDGVRRDAEGAPPLAAVLALARAEAREADR
jgi:ATP-dependent Lhr-like helicase